MSTVCPPRHTLLLPDIDFVSGGSVLNATSCSMGSQDFAYKREQNIPLGKPSRCKWDNNIKVDLTWDCVSGQG